MLCRAVALGGAVCVLGIRPYATLVSLDDLGYGILEQSVDGPSRLAHVVDQIRVRVSPGERCRRHPAVIILPEAIRLVPTAEVHRLYFGRKRRRRQYHSNDTGVLVYS